VLAAMLHCGMYEASGAWAMDVGIPAKSGVSGAVWAVIPGVGGLCAHQARIDETGNSVQASALLRGMVRRAPSISVFHCN
jgi:glutaminase